MGTASTVVAVPTTTGSPHLASGVEAPRQQLLDAPERNPDGIEDEGAGGGHGIGGSELATLEQGADGRHRQRDQCGCRHQAGDDDVAHGAGRELVRSRSLPSSARLDKYG